MTAVAAEASDVTTELEELLAHIELIACGKDSYPGKTHTCDRHQDKGEGLLRIASRGAVDALAAAICGSERKSSCTTCTGKALEIIRVCSKGAE